MSSVKLAAAVSAPPVTPDLSMFGNLTVDAPAGLVVFLVALPLCLGIALASGAPMFSGLVAGMVGGLVVPLISRSPLSVCGPAAGLAAIVAAGIQHAGDYQAFCLAVALSGVMQAAMGVLRAGALTGYVPGAVIKGMLTGIGLLLVVKQTPVALGWHATSEPSVFSHAHLGAVLIGVASLTLLIQWARTPLSKVVLLPSALGVVVVATGLSELLRAFIPSMALAADNLVSMPTGVLTQQFTMPLWSSLLNPDVWASAATICVVATLESLLSISAVDRLDPFKRRTPMNRELVAQGIGNLLSGLLGGLPVTSVIVRSSTAVNAGARTRSATMVHGLLLLLSVAFARDLLVHIPLSALACILIMTGYKLAHPSIFRDLYRSGQAQFLPFIVTVAGILLTDLLRGIALGFIVALVFMVRTHAASAYRMHEDGGDIHIHLTHEAYFFSKAALLSKLDGIPAGKRVVIDGSAASFVDPDVREALHQFCDDALARGIQVELHAIEPVGQAAGGH